MSPVPAPSTDAYTQALAALLPPGAAWPRDLTSVWMRLLIGLAGTLQALHAFTHQTAAEWLPQDTHTRLPEWEAALGLPDACLDALQTEDQRRAAVLARLRGHQGAYADSSPAAPGAIANYAAELGLPATVVASRPFRVGRDRVGSRLGRNGKLTVAVAAAGSSEPFRVGTHRVGRRLVERPPQVSQIACLLEHVAPARFEIVVEVV
jgi:uncharacterized protein YmfQ (DUF2313 family)